MREACWECVIKHLSAAWTYSNAVKAGTRENMLMVGHIAEASEELAEYWPGTAAIYAAAAAAVAYVPESSESLSFGDELSRLKAAEASTDIPDDDGSTYMLLEGVEGDKLPLVRCAVHLAQCLVLVGEVFGYPEHQFLITGHLAAAEELLIPKYYGTQQSIRKLRLLATENLAATAKELEKLYAECMSLVVKHEAETPEAEG